MSLPVLLGAAVVLLFAHAFGQPGPCERAEFSFSSVARLLLCAAAIAAFGAALACVPSTRWLIWIQFALLAGVAAVHWWVLSGDATEASGRPYQHVFALVAPALCFAVCLAPLIVRAKFKPWAGFKKKTGRYFAKRLPQRELFVPGGSDPELTLDRIVYALVHGTLYRPLQLLLPPALLAFVAPPNWLAWLVLTGFVFSVLMLAWGSIDNRWQQMVTIVERWFLRGTSLPVSLFVIVIAALRVFQVDYVTTIIDSALFGVLFGVVVMSYVLSWLIEYWVNRAVGVEVLQMLGNGSDAAGMPYPINVAPDPNIRVAQPGRYLTSHGIGRFLVVGTLIPKEGEAVLPAPAFHTYDLLSFLTSLAGGEDQNVAEVGRHTNFYFYIVNALLMLVLACFGVFSVYHSRISVVKAVVTTSVPPPVKSDAMPTSELKDLAAKLVAAPGTKPRPAIIVVGSGGGTRAAVYTAHVLEGLHRLGVDDDIVLISGVSGGGVALAFFAANYTKLTRQDATDAAWGKFKNDVSDKFIQDVLESATEWRVFGSTPLTTLLAESFDRRLPAKNMSFNDLSAAPPLILNTTIVGHPADDSDLLRKTLDPLEADAPSRCVEEERSFTLMKGGRLIFTNLRNTSEFPQRNSDSIF